jgi:DNA repair protein RAD16
MCRNLIDRNKVYKITTEEKSAKEKGKGKEKITELNELIKQHGTKMAHIIIHLKELAQKKEKAILFSQWDSLLTKIMKTLSDSGIKNCRVKGSIFQRKKTVKRFVESEDILVMCLSTQNSASGLNLQVATNILILDPIYGTKEYHDNTKQQIIGRAYRIGQTKPVKVVNFLIKNTIEEKVYNGLETTMVEN